MPGYEPELRALAWKRGGEVLAGGVHVHGHTTALGAIRARSRADAAKVLAAAPAEGGAGVVHGEDVLVALVRAKDRAARERRR